MTALGAYLREERVGNGLTHRDVAELLAMLKLTGMNRPWPGVANGVDHLAKIEAGARWPSERQLLALRLVLPRLRLDRARRLLAEQVAEERRVEARVGRG